MIKGLQPSGNGGRAIVELIDMIDRLGGYHRERMLQIVLMLAEAPKPVQQVAHTMLRRFVDSPPASRRECIAEVDAVLSYLEGEVALPGDDASAELAGRTRIN